MQTARTPSVKSIRSSTVQLLELHSERQSTSVLNRGLIIESLHGETYSYELNTRHIMYEAIQLLASSRTRVIAPLSSQMSTWPVQPLSPQIFGSAARGEMTVISDIDDRADDGGSPRWLTETSGNREPIEVAA